MITAKEASIIIIANMEEEAKRKEAERIKKEEERKKKEVEAINNFCDNHLMPLITSATEPIIHTGYFTGTYKDRLGVYDECYRKHNGNNVSVIWGYIPLNFELLFAYLKVLGYKAYFKETTLSLTSWCGYSRHNSTTNELIIEIEI